MEWMKNYIGTKYELGVNDCFTFCNDYIRQEYDVDVLERFRGYRTEMDVKRLLVREGFQSVEDMLIAEMVKLGFKEQAVGTKEFDIALCELSAEGVGMRAFGLPNGTGSAWCFWESGFYAVIPKNIIRTFKYKEVV